jgi:lipopolysaccharide/colanic/teichoic acid biosynthesis glycosyltransferase
VPIQLYHPINQPSELTTTKIHDSLLFKKNHNNTHDSTADLYEEEFFNDLLRVEKRRTERSRRPFLLMLIDLEHLDPHEKGEVARQLAITLLSTTRETDVKGWYKRASVIGIIFTEPNPDNNIACFQDMISDKVCGGIKSVIGLDRFSKLEIELHIFPQDPLEVSSGVNKAEKECRDLTAKNADKKMLLEIKRALDVLGSFVAILLALPLLLLISAAVKLSSPGPILFRQERVGQFGKRFMFLKFRSMYVDNDPTAHREFVTQLIDAGNGNAGPGNKENGTYKITDDPRVTPVGRWLRKMSLDELPQFINVLKGEMSLVGPRPPIPYECEHYDIWHRRRVTEAKPGITGLWQVEGRSALPFDEAVRLDIKYIREWSLWLDFKILIQTPWVVLTCKGGY